MTDDRRAYDGGDFQVPIRKENVEAFAQGLGRVSVYSNVNLDQDNAPAPRTSVQLDRRGSRVRRRSRLAGRILQPLAESIVGRDAAEPVHF